MSYVGLLDFQVRLCFALAGNPTTYLGVKLDSKLSWAKHITEITTKSSNVLGMVKRTLGPCKPEVKDTAYSMLVRPKLEYASPIWNPHTSSQINRLERFQHYAARFVANDHRRTTSPTTLVQTLNWQTLERRRTIQFNSIQFHLFPAHINISYSNDNMYNMCRKRGGQKTVLMNVRPLTITSKL